LIICSSCWQSITPFEEKVGNLPDPCKVPIVNLQTGALKILDFSDNNEEIEEENCKDIEKDKKNDKNIINNKAIEDKKEIICEKNMEVVKNA
jgi:hypothetical protein